MNTANAFMTTCPYPWQHTVWQPLLNRIQQKNLPHGLLFAGNAGLGKFAFAKAFANYLLCAQQSGCGECRACQLNRARTHPDHILIVPEEGSSTIKIDQIRELVAISSQTAQQGGLKVIIISPAQGLNIAASNALLKTLEEPSSNTVIILVTEQLTALAATLRSRCQIVYFNVPDFTIAQAWLASQNVPTKDIKQALQLASGAPLQALYFLQQGFLEQRSTLLKNLLALSQGEANPIKVAEECMKYDLNEVLNWLSVWILETIRLNLGCLDIKTEESIIFIKSKFNLRSLFYFLDELTLAKQHIQKKVNLNIQLLLEKLLCSWQDLSQTS